MRVAFAGTPEFAQTALAAILAAGFKIPLVLTQPDRPAGRGQKLQPSPVKALALQHGLTVYQPERLKDPASHQPLIDSSIDVMVVAAYGLILPQAVLDIPKLGCINIHASLLPRWRGAAPIQRAIEAGDPETGVTIMRVTAGLDAGPMLLAEATPITGQDNARTVHDRLANLGAQLVVRALRGLPALIPREQPDAGVTYARKIEKGEAHLDLREPAVLLARRIRAFDPFPGACVTLEGTTIKFWHATAEADRGPVGQIPTGQILAADSQGVLVACGEGALRITELQKPGGKRLPSADFLRGFPLAVGQQFALP